PSTERPVPAGGVARRTTRGLSALLFRPIGTESRGCFRRIRPPAGHLAPHVPVVPDVPATGPSGRVISTGRANSHASPAGPARTCLYVESPTENPPGWETRRSRQAVTRPGDAVPWTGVAMRS